jgi:hypothetical protein
MCLDQSDHSLARQRLDWDIRLPFSICLVAVRTVSFSFLLYYIVDRILYIRTRILEEWNK